MRGSELVRSFETSGDNSLLTTQGVQQGFPHRLLLVTVKYSTSVTQDITITLKSGIDASYDVILAIISLSSSDNGYFYPDAELFLSPDDYVEVSAPAAGGSDTSAVVIYEELIRW